METKTGIVTFSARLGFFRSRWKSKSNGFRFSVQFFQSIWKPKPKPNHFRFSVRPFLVEMESETKSNRFRFGFSGQNGNQNRNQTNFDFRLSSVFPVEMETEKFLIFGSVFSVSVLVSRFFRFRFVLVFTHLIFYNSIQPNTPKMHGQIPSNSIPIPSKSNCFMNSNSIEFHSANQTPENSRLAMSSWTPGL